MRDIDLESDPLMRQWANLKTDNQSASVFQVDLGKSVPWIAFSWFLSGGAIIGLILMALLMPQIIRSEVGKGVAEAKADMAQQIADVKASVNTARQDSRIALDKIEQTQVQLGAKGLVQPSTH